MTEDRTHSGSEKGSSPDRGSRLELGAAGEEIAAEYLRECGYRVLARNWRCPEGEIDIVVADDDWVVVVEVKTRSSHAAGHPFESVTPTKLARLRRLAGAWARENPREGSRLRVDAVAVTVAAGTAPPTVEHLENVA